MSKVKKRTTKKLLAILVMVTMLFSSFSSIPVYATETASETDAVEISSYTDTTEETTQTTTEGTESTSTVMGVFVDNVPLLKSINNSSITIKARNSTGTENFGNYVNAEGNQLIGYDSGTNTTILWHSFIEAKSGSDGTVAYCLQAGRTTPSTSGETYNKLAISSSIASSLGGNGYYGSTPLTEADIASALIAVKFMYGGGYADPNSAFFNIHDGGTYGTYITESGKVKGLMIGGKVYPLTDEEARVVSAYAVHSSFDKSVINSMSAKSTSNNVWGAYTHLHNIYVNGKSQITTLSAGRNAVDVADAYVPTQKLTWYVKNAKTNSWEEYSKSAYNNSKRLEDVKYDTSKTITDDLGDNYINASGNVEFKVEYSSSGMCNKLVTNSSSGNKTVSGNTSGNGYLMFSEGSGNNVPFTVNIGEVTASKENIGDYISGMRYDKDVFSQSATLTVKASDLQRNGAEFKVNAYTGEGTTATPYYNGTDYSASIYVPADTTGQECAVISSTSPMYILAELDADVVGVGSLKVEKRSSDTSITNGNGKYDLGNAEYEVKDSSGTVVGKFKTETITTDTTVAVGKVTYAKYNSANVGTDTLTDLPLGDYTVTETVAPTNYEIDTTPHNITLTADNVNTPLVFKHTDTPVPFGQLKVEKRSARPDITNNNPCYDLGNAEYEVVDDAGTVVGKFKTETITTDTTVAIGKVTYAKYNSANVGTDTLTDLPLGRYTVKETKAPKNYQLGNDQSIVVTSNHVHTPYVFAHEDMPDNDPLTLSIEKNDYEFLDEDGKEKVDAKLEGTEFTVKYYANLDWDSVDDIPTNAIPTKTWVVGVKKTTETNAEGKQVTIFRADLDDAHKVSGDEFYKDAGGQVIIPYGCITVEETKTTNAYKEWIENVTIVDEKNNTISGNIYFRQINDSNPPSADWGITAQNKITRTEFTFEKINYKTREKMVNIPFRLSLLDDNGNVIESHIIVTDENGKFDTSAVAHSTNTNGNDNAVPDSKGNYDGLTPKGVWFYGTTEQGHSKIIDSEGALLYGHYKLEELKCSNNEGLQLIVAENFDILDSTKKNVGTVSNVPEPQIETEVRDKNTNSHFSVIGNNVTLIDTVDYYYLTVDTTYTLWGLLIDANTGKPLKDKNGNIIVSKPVVFTTPSTYVESKQEICDKTDVTFNFDATGMDGKDIVIYQYLYEGDKSSGYDFLDANGNIVEGSYLLSHDMRDNTKQTFYFPSIKTEAFSIETQSNTLSADENVNIGDMVFLDNLMEGETYELVATLVNKNTGEPLKNDKGEVIVSREKVFKATSSTMTVNVFFPTIKRELITSQEADIVVFEELIWKKSTGDISYAKHTDINDTAQTLTAVTIGTKATSLDGDKIVPACEDATVTDTVTYRNLTPNEEYELTGTLMVKGTNKPLLDKDGNEITATKTFVPTKKDGTTDLTFTFDASLLQGETLVVFESLSFEGIEVAFHTDIEDKDQTVDVAQISTSLVGKDNGDKTAYLGKNVTLVDTITYENFVPNREYKISGILMNKDTGLPLMKKGSLLDFVVVEKTFTPTEKNGTVDVEFTFDAYSVGIIKEDGTVSDIVCFETVYFTDVTVDETTGEQKETEKVFAYHTDINAVSQTVKILKPEVSTSLADDYTGVPTAYMNDDVTLVDTITYKNFAPNIEYKIEGTLMNKDTGLPLIDSATGQPITVSKTFIPTKSSGTVEVKFNLNVFNVGIIKEDNSVSDIVCFEKVFIVGKGTAETEVENTFYVSHEDINAISQTVNVSSGRTTAKDGKTNTHTGSPDEKATIIDTVYYANLIPNKSYTLKGKLWTKDEEGKAIPFLDNGKEVTSEVTFKPDKATGSIEMVFKFNASSLKGSGKSVVVFEDCYEENTDILVFTHSNIEDKDQSIEYPKMWTEIKDKNGNKSLEPEHKYTLIDTITYENLVVGETYVIEGVLMEKVVTYDTNGNVTSVSEKEYVNPSGNKSTAVVEFTPTEKNGKVDVGFEFYTSEDTYNKTFVCFERIYTKETHTEICSHTDINDAKQSFTVSDQVKTGDFPIGLVGGLMAFALAGIIFMLTSRKKDKGIPLIKM